MSIGSAVLLVRRLLQHAMFLCVCSIIPLSAMAQRVVTPSAGTEAVHVQPGATSVVRVQPRGSDFMPNSSDEKTVQGHLENFNEDQKLMDALFDKRLIICRGC
jgi:hypothetical protein